MRKLAPGHGFDSPIAGRHQPHSEEAMQALLVQFQARYALLTASIAATNGLGTAAFQWPGQ